MTVEELNVDDGKQKSIIFLDFGLSVINSLIQSGWVSKVGLVWLVQSSLFDWVD